MQPKEQICGILTCNGRVQQRRQAAWVQSAKFGKVVDFTINHDPQVAVAIVFCHLLQPVFRGWRDHGVD